MRLLLLSLIGSVVLSPVNATPIRYEITGVIESARIQGVLPTSAFNLGGTFSGGFWYNPDATLDPNNPSVFRNVMTYDFQIGTEHVFDAASGLFPMLRVVGPRTGIDTNFFVFDDIPRWDGLLASANGFVLDDLDLILNANVLHWVDEEHVPAELDISNFTGGEFTGFWFSTGNPNPRADFALVTARVDSIRKVPEPATLALLIVGMGSLWLAMAGRARVTVRSL